MSGNQGWYHKANLYQWARGAEGLAVHLAPRDYPAVFKEIERERLSRVALGILKILFEHGAIEPLNPLSRAVTKRELADRLATSAGSIADAVNRINTLVVRGAREGTMARQWGLVWRNEYGVGIHPGMDDLQRAKAMSDKQIAGQNATWSQNKKIATETQEDAETRNMARKLAALTPEQRRALMVSVGAPS